MSKNESKAKAYQAAGYMAGRFYIRRFLTKNEAEDMAKALEKANGVSFTVGECR